MPTTVTKTVKPSGGDYASLSAWESAEQADIVTADETHVVEVSAFSGGLDDVVTIAGWTTDATRRIKIKAAAADAHEGKWDTAKAWVRNGTANTTSIIQTSNVGFVDIEGLQFELNDVSSAGIVAGLQFDGPSSLTTNFVDRCIIKGGTITGAGGTPIGVLNRETGAGASDVYIANTAIFDIVNSDFPNSAAPTAVESVFGDIWSYNVTAHNCGTGFRGNATYAFRAKNCLADCNSQNANYVDFSGTFDADSTHNASSDATAPGSTGARTSQTFTFVDAANGDLHLDSGDAGALDFGTDLSGDADNPISVDIDNVTRTGTWDIGADEFVSAGGGATHPVNPFGHPLCGPFAGPIGF